MLWDAAWDQQNVIEDKLYSDHIAGIMSRSGEAPGPSTTPGTGAVPTPGGSTPGGSTPGGSTPGGSTPGGSTPGGSTPVGPTPSGSTPTPPSPGGGGGGAGMIISTYL